VNARAISVVGRVRQIFATIPGIDSLVCNDGRTWTVVTVRAVSDDTVHQLALLYGLGEVQERRAERAGGGCRWYLGASSQRTVRGQGSIRFDIVGPAHLEGPDENGRPS
jgi:hypothetical protein